jgi:hypothetical protein
MSDNPLMVDGVKDGAAARNWPPVDVAMTGKTANKTAPDLPVEEEKIMENKKYLTLIEKMIILLSFIEKWFSEACLVGVQEKGFPFYSSLVTYQHRAREKLKGNPFSLWCKYGDFVPTGKRRGCHAGDPVNCHLIAFVNFKGG